MFAAKAANEGRVKSAECRVMEAFLALLEKYIEIILFCLDIPLFIQTL